MLHHFSAFHLSNWKKATSNNWVIRTLEDGYTLQFCHRPPRFAGVLKTPLRDFTLTPALRSEVAALLQKQAIEEVGPLEQNCGFYSIYFLAPKKDGGVRPILDLRRLNQYLSALPFKMLTLKTILQSVQPGDWFTTIDLKDAYFHVPILPSHRQYLRFAFDDKVFQFRVLPFGLSLAPRTFTKCMAAALAPLRREGVQILNYLDDWLICTASKVMALRHTKMVMDHLTGLGLTINGEKSNLVPSQSTQFLGIILDSPSMKAKLSQERVASMLKMISLFKLRRLVTALECQRLIGLMAAAAHVVPLGLLHMRPIQRWYLRHQLCPKRDRNRRLSVTASCWKSIQWWCRTLRNMTGVSLGMVHHRVTLTTDASLTGWGGVLEQQGVHGVWSPPWATAHINVLELKAANLALQHFLPILRGKHVLLRTDNTTVVAQVNRQGGLRSLTLHQVARELLIWAHGNLASLRAMYLPGTENQAADMLSRGGAPASEWMIHPAVIRAVWAHYGAPVADLFASQAAHHCHMWFSIKGSPGPLGVDAFSHRWPTGLLYAFPPVALLPQVLNKIRQERATVLLIAPNWPQSHWFAELMQLLAGRPLELPQRADLLSQADNRLWHPNPGRLQLWAWPLNASGF